MSTGGQFSGRISCVWGTIFKNIPKFLASFFISVVEKKCSFSFLCSNPKMDQLASTSLDKTLKVWRVFPFAEEALTPLMLFEHSMGIYGMIFSNKSLCVIYQDMSRAYHTIGKILMHTCKVRYRDIWGILDVGSSDGIRLVSKTVESRPANFQQKSHKFRNLLRPSVRPLFFIFLPHFSIVVHINLTL